MIFFNIKFKYFQVIIDTVVGEKWTDKRSRKKNMQ